MKSPTPTSSITVTFDSFRICCASVIGHFWWKTCRTWLYCIQRLLTLQEKLRHFPACICLHSSGFFFHFQTHEASLQVLVFYISFLRPSDLPSWHSHALSSPFLLSLENTLWNTVAKTANLVEGLNWTLQLLFHLIFFMVLWIGFDIVSLL